MKVLITGANGQLGYHLKQVFSDHQLFLGDVVNFDITNKTMVMEQTDQFQPDLIIHGAAYTNVDKAEIDKDLCWQINVTGTQHVVEAARKVDAKLIAISTDYVFAGDKGTPYLESDQPGPLSYYGQTKYEAEKLVISLSKHWLCRTSWLYGGPKPTRDFDFTQPGLPKNFVYTMLRVGKDRESVEVVNDQYGGPTYAQDLAEHLKKLVALGEPGIYHLTNAGTTSWAQFAQEIFRLASYPTKVVGITSQEWLAKNPQSTQRPPYSVLGHEHLIEVGLPDLRRWQDAIADYLSELR